MPTNLGQAVEDYLKTIFAIAGPSGRATTNEIADRMGVRPASVTGMLQKLAASSPPLVDYQKRHGVILTEVGKSVALEIIRHHRLLELFLHDTLGYTWDEVHPEADLLEHVISEQFEERIAAVLGNPSNDPHGDPIPSRDLLLLPESRPALNNLASGQQAIIQRVASSDADLLKYLASVGVVPKVHVEVVSVSPYDDTIKIRVEGYSESVVLGSKITSRIFVDELGE
jgi:DtxR family Mn-dependent transcriptional regulator